MPATTEGASALPSGTEFRFKTATQEDVPALAAVFAQSVEYSCGSDYTSEQLRAWIARATLARWRELFGSSLHFIKATVADGPIVGFASVDASGYLHSMFVLSSFQRQGVASALLTHAVAYARLHGAVRIHTEASLTARPFFSRQGFSTDARQQVELGSELLTNFKMSRLL